MQAYVLILKASQGKGDGVPVSWFWYNSSLPNFANWPKSAGMGPGIYKIQSKHTKNKSRYPTCKIWLRNASQCLNNEGMSREEGWKPVSLFTNKISSFKFANWPNSAGMGPKVYKTKSKHTQKQVTLSYWCERALGKQAYCFILNASQRKKGWSTGKLVFG